MHAAIWRSWCNIRSFFPVTVLSIDFHLAENGPGEMSGSSVSGMIVEDESANNVGNS
jgi:hypothetical protein